MTTNQKEMFGSLLLDKKIVTALTDMGFEEPSPIQEQTIPLVLDGYDVIGQAQTGTGKTAAFGIPLVQSITDHKHIQALIMTPTRELAIQVAEEVGKIGRTSRIKALPVYGGQPIERQIRALKSGVQIVIGTPGRLIDHINRNTIKLDHIKFLVLDEADEMLDMYSKCMVSESAEKLVHNGNIFTSGNTLLKMNHKEGQTVRVYTHDGKFIGLYMFIADKQIYKPIKMFL